jgi:hypothetical protein
VVEEVGEEQRSLPQPMVLLVEQGEVMAVEVGEVELV